MQMLLLFWINNLSNFNFLALRALQRRERLRFNLEVRSCSKKLKFFKNKYSPEKKLDFEAKFEKIRDHFSQQRLALDWNLNGENSISWLSPVHWLSAVHCRPGALAGAWSNQCVTVLSVSAARLFRNIRKQFFLLNIQSNFNSLALKAFAKNKRLSLFFEKND